MGAKADCPKLFTAALCNREQWKQPSSVQNWIKELGFIHMYKITHELKSIKHCYLDTSQNHNGELKSNCERNT